MSEQKYFEPIDTDICIPSINENGIAYTKVSKELFNEAVLKGFMSNKGEVSD